MALDLNTCPRSEGVQSEGGDEGVGMAVGGSSGEWRRCGMIHTNILPDKTRDRSLNELLTTLDPISY